MCAISTAQYRHGIFDFLLACAVDDEFVDRNEAVVVEIHRFEYSLHVQFGIIIPRSVPSHQLMDRVHNLKHFLLADNSVIVDVVKSECPQQFVSGGSFADDGQELHEVAESYATSTIPVNCCKDQVCILASVAQWKDLLVNFFKGFFVDNPIGTLLFKGSVQMANLVFSEFCVLCHLLKVTWFISARLQNVHVDILFLDLLLSLGQLYQKPYESIFVLRQILLLLFALFRFTDCILTTHIDGRSHFP